MSLVVWLPLINNIENQGNSNITITNNGATLSTGGKLGDCYYFNGSAQYLQFSDTLGDIYVKDFTWAVWLKPVDSTRGVICSEYSAAGASGIAFELTASLGLRIWWNGSPDIYPTNCTLTKDIWQHVAICKTTDKLEFYINGELRATYTGTLSDRTSTAKIRIGDDYRGGTSVSYMGYINDFRLYDHALSPREVKEISKGLILHYTFDNNGSGQANLLSRYVSAGQNAPSSTSNGGRLLYYGDYGIQIPATENADTYFRLFLKEQLVVGDTYTISCHASGLLSGTYYRFPLFAQGNTSMGILDINHNGLNQLTFTMNSSSQTAVQVSSSETVYICFMDDSGRNIVSGQGTITLTNFKIEKGSKVTPWTPASTDPRYAELGFSDNTIYDSSGYCNNGTINGSLTYSEDAPRYSISTVFNGTNNYLSASALPAETYTLSVWIKTTWKNPSSYKLAVYSTSSKLSIGFSGDHLISYIGSSGGGAGSSVSTSNYVANEWNHIVVVKTGETTRTVYINGQVASNVSNNWWGDGGVTNLFIGARYYSSYRDYFDGQLSDFRAYATALSQEDILELYHTSASVSDNGTLFAYTFNEE